MRLCDMQDKELMCNNCKFVPPCELCTFVELKSISNPVKIMSGNVFVGIHSGNTGTGSQRVSARKVRGGSRK